MVQWLRLHAPDAEGQGSIPGQGTRYPNATSKTWLSQILDAWGWCAGTTQRDGMGREEGSGWGTRVYLWRIHVDI